MNLDEREPEGMEEEMAELGGGGNASEEEIIMDQLGGGGNASKFVVWRKRWSSLVVEQGMRVYSM
jgi:hypothetical protein